MDIDRNFTSYIKDKVNWLVTDNNFTYYSNVMVNTTSILEDNAVVKYKVGVLDQYKQNGVSKYITYPLELEYVDINSIESDVLISNSNISFLARIRYNNEDKIIKLTPIKSVIKQIEPEPGTYDITITNPITELKADKSHKLEVNATPEDKLKSIGLLANDYSIVKINIVDKDMCITAMKEGDAEIFIVGMFENNQIVVKNMNINILPKEITDTEDNTNKEEVSNNVISSNGNVPPFSAQDLKAFQELLNKLNIIGKDKVENNSNSNSNVNTEDNSDLKDSDAIPGLLHTNTNCPNKDTSTNTNNPTDNTNSNTTEENVTDIDNSTNDVNTNAPNTDTTINNPVVPPVEDSGNTDTNTNVNQNVNTNNNSFNIVENIIPSVPNVADQEDTSTSTTTPVVPDSSTTEQDTNANVSGSTTTDTSTNQIEQEVAQAPSTSTDVEDNTQQDTNVNNPVVSDTDSTNSNTTEDAVSTTTEEDVTDTQQASDSTE